MQQSRERRLTSIRTSVQSSKGCDGGESDRVADRVGFCSFRWRFLLGRFVVVLAMFTVMLAMLVKLALEAEGLELRSEMLRSLHERGLVGG